MNSVKGIIFSVIVIGCAGPEFAYEPEGMAGAAGESSSAGAAGDDNVGAAGVLNETGGTAGSNNVAGGMNSGGSNLGGIGNIAGSAGASNSGGSAGVSNSGGSAGVPNNSGGTGGNDCKPLTCAEYAFKMTGNTQAKSCGIIEDGCGSVIDCSSCSNDETCGGPKFVLNEDPNANNPELFNWEPGIANICGGGCKYVGFQMENGCPHEHSPYSYYYTCANSIEDQPQTNNSNAICDQVSENNWCCSHK